jgi:DNA-binding CsgD family transcriptional regulator
MTASPLTKRETQILRLIAKDLSLKEIAASLGIARKTVDYHRKALKAKLGVKGSAGMVRYAIRAGLIKP